MRRRKRYRDHRWVRSISELNKGKIRLFVDAVLNEGRLDLIDELVAADYIGHIPCVDRDVIGPNGVRQLVSSYRRVHHDLYVKVEDQIAEDDRVVTRWLATSTHDGNGSGVSRARTHCCAGISIVRLLAGRQVDSLTECADFRRIADEADDGQERR